MVRLTRRKLSREAHDVAYRALRRGKYLVGHHPALLPVLLRLTPEGIGRRITASTDLVVEGFPRAGNTFTVFALQNAADNRLRIASHVHHPAQVRHAVALGVPTVLVVREPVATLASYLVFGQHGRAPRVTEEYRDYHREVIPYLDGLMVCEFDEITTDLSAVIARINRRWSLQIPAFDQSAENVERVFADISRHHALVHKKQSPDTVAPRPMMARSEFSQQRRAELLAPRNSRRLAEARGVYEFYAAKAAEQRALFQPSEFNPG